MNRKVLVGILFMLFLIEIVPAITTTSSQTPPSASAYVASISVSSNPFILNTTLPAINQLGSNIRFFEYPNLTGQLYAYEQQLPQTIATVNSVESTGWKVYPYWQNGELVINSIGGTGQYIAWRYSPISNTINITVHVSSFPVTANNPGIDIFSANPSTAYDWQTGNYYWLAIQWSGAYQYSTPSGYLSPVTGSPSIPNLMGKAFTETVILTENSAGNITISQIYVNGTLYSTPNINVPFPWNQIYWIGIRGDGGSLFYVSYFSVSPAPYGGVEQFVNNVESMYNIFSDWQNGQLLVDTFPVVVTVTNSQSIATPAPFDQFLNITESQIASALGSSLASQLWQQAMSDHFLNLLFTQNGQPLYAWIQNYTSSWVAVWVKLPNGIPASSSASIYIYFTNSIQYPYTGIYSAVYPGYDNGEDVFIQYGYFGNQIPSGWTVGVFGGSFSPKLTANGLEMTNNSGGEGTYVYASLPNTNDYTVIVSWWYNGTADGFVQELYGNVSKLTFVDSIGSTPGGFTPYASGGTVVQNEFFDSTAYVKNATTSNSTGFDRNGIVYVTTYFAIQGNTQYYGYSNHNSPFQITLPSSFATFHLITDRTEPTVLIGAGTGGSYAYIYLDVVIVIPTPPNNVMPSITSVSNGGIGGQYIAWRYTPISNTINITIHVASFPEYNAWPGIDILSLNPNKGGDAGGGSYWLAIQWPGDYQYSTPTYISPIIGSSSIPNLMGKVFTETVILTENSAGNITISQIYVNGTLYSTPNINIPFPWNQIGYIGIRGDTCNLFYVSYFGVTQLLDAYSLVTNPATNTPYTGTVYVAVFPYPISYDVYVSPAPIVSSQSPLPTFSPSFTSTTTPYPVISTSTSSGTVNVIPSIGAWTSTSTPLFLTTLAVGNQIYANIPMVESTSWRVYPYWENGELVINSTGESVGKQYIAWRYSPISNTINITIHVTSFPVHNWNPGIDIFSPNVGDLSSEDFPGFFWLLVGFYGGTIQFHTPGGSGGLLYSSLPNPNPNYPFTFSVILTENSAGNITVSTVYINSTAYSVNVSTPFPWNQIGYIGIRGDLDNIFYVSYFAVNSIPLVSSSGVTSFNFYSPFSLPYNITNASITVQNTQLVDGENYLIIPGTNGIIGASFAFYNVTNNVPVLAISSSPVSVTYNSPARTFTVVSASQTFLVSPFGAPEQNYQSLTGSVVILPQSGQVTFYASYRPGLVPSSTASPPPPSTTTTTPTTTTTSINPNQATVVINGSVYLTAPWLVHYSIPSVNSSATAYLIYNYSTNKPELVLSSPTNVNVSVTFTASNGTVLLSESVMSPTTVTLPVATGNVTVKTTNSTITIPITYQRFNVVSLTNAIMNSPIMGAVAVLMLFFVSFYIGFVFRTVPNAMALGAVVYITAVAPFLLAIGFPMSIVMLTVVLAVVALIYSVWALRVTNVRE